VAALAKAAVFDPVLPNNTGPGVIQMPCMCMRLPAPVEEKAFVEEAMHAAVIPAQRQAQRR
jgi:hypothetical protein